MDKIGLACAALLMTSFAWADCNRPDAPKVPDGSEAEREEMLEAHGEVQQFISDGTSYLECLKEEEAAEVASEAATEESVKQRMGRYNDMVDKMQTVGDDFNAALKQFNARQQ